MAGGYETIEHTADVLVKCHGVTLEECFETAARALFEQMVDLEDVSTSETCIFRVEGGDREELLYAFLSELIFLFDAYGMVLKEFDVEFEDGSLRCEARGERLDLSRHTALGAVKAITYHMLDVDPQEPSVTVLFDV